MEITKPTLVVDLKIAEQNIKRMAEKFTQKGIQFRPHFKTHQSHFIGELYRKFGITKCTVSSVGMASYFAKNEWTDITIAFPANLLEIKEMNALAEQIQLQILVDSLEKVKILSEGISPKISLFIEIDTGYFRSGILWEELTQIEEVIRAIEAVPQFAFVGFLSHTGNTYSQPKVEDVLSLFDTSRRKMLDLKHYFIRDYQNLILSLGDTPAASLAIEFDGVDEMRPGNFVFYDVMQYLLGACKVENIAVAVYCPVVAKYPKRNQIVIYGGGVHLSKEKLKWKGKDIFGLVSIPDEQGFGRLISGAYVESLSQEHGLINMPSTEIDQINLGDLLAIYPIHSCMTVDLNIEMLSLDGSVISKYRTY
ncbi:MAG: alanine racemase [Bacteroidales bacterium]|nr:alanine racemase [Bacteroidales bacterium]